MLVSRDYYYKRAKPRAADRAKRNQLQRSDAKSLR
jgi:hypothetical protein